MEETHKITEKQLLFLKKFLKKYGIPKDECVELMDHLITEFEHCGNDNLSQYLSKKLTFIRSYTSRKKNVLFVQNKRIVWKELCNFFTDMKKLPITMTVFGAIYFSSKTLVDKTLIITFMISVIIPTIYGFVLTFHRNKEVRKLFGINNLFGILSLSHIFLYFFTPFKDFLLNNIIVFSIYWFIAFATNISGLIVVKRKRKEILKKYNFLLEKDI